jgi:hypothetical protein
MGLERRLGGHSRSRQRPQTPYFFPVKLKRLCDACGVIQQPRVALMQQCQLDLNPVIVATLGALAVDAKACVAPAPSHPAVGTLGARVRPSLLAPSAPRSGPTHSLLARAGDVYPCRAVYPGSRQGTIASVAETHYGCQLDE